MFENWKVSIFDSKTNEKEYTEQINYPLFDVGGLMVSLLTSIRLVYYNYNHLIEMQLVPVMIYM
jgi:hypothetical protein